MPSYAKVKVLLIFSYFRFMFILPSQNGTYSQPSFPKVAMVLGSWVLDLCCVLYLFKSIC